MGIFFSSDPHYGHANVIKYCGRPFADVDEMNEAMVRRWNETIGPDDTVYVLGDFSLSKQYASKFGPRLMGTKHLIAGNHDECHPVRAKTEVRAQNLRKLYYDAGFASIKLEDEIEIDGRKVLLHHFPYRDHDRDDLRYPELRPEDRGGWLLHGHVHERWRVRDRMLNVGVDVWDFRPVSIDEIADLIRRASA